MKFNTFHYSLVDEKAVVEGGGAIGKTPECIFFSNALVAGPLEWV